MMLTFYIFKAMHLRLGVISQLRIYNCICILQEVMKVQLCVRSEVDLTISVLLNSHAPRTKCA